MYSKIRLFFPTGITRINCTTVAASTISVQDRIQSRSVLPYRVGTQSVYSATAQWKTTAQRLITSHRRPYRQQYLASRASTPACGFGAALRNCTGVIYWPHIAGLSRLSAPCTLEQCSLGRLILPPLPRRTAKHKWPCPWPGSNRRHPPRFTVRRSFQLSYKGICAGAATEATPAIELLPV